MLLSPSPDYPDYFCPDFSIPKYCWISMKFGVDVLWVVPQGVLSQYVGIPSYSPVRGENRSKISHFVNIVSKLISAIFKVSQKIFFFDFRDTVSFCVYILIRTIYRSHKIAKSIQVRPNGRIVLSLCFLGHFLRTAHTVAVTRQELNGVFFPLLHRRQDKSIFGL